MVSRQIVGNPEEVEIAGRRGVKSCVAPDKELSGARVENMLNLGPPAPLLSPDIVPQNDLGYLTIALLGPSARIRSGGEKNCCSNRQNKTKLDVHDEPSEPKNLL